VKPVEVEGIEEWEVEKILNKRKIWRVDRYLVQWKRFIAESDIWEKEADLKNVRELVDEFEGRLGAEVRRQEGVEGKTKSKSNLRAEKYKRRELPGRYIAILLYGWDDGKFEEEYLRKLERNWQKWKSVSLEKKP